MSPELVVLAHKMCKYQLAWEPERYNRVSDIVSLKHQSSSTQSSSIRHERSLLNEF